MTDTEQLLSDSIDKISELAIENHRLKAQVKELLEENKNLRDNYEQYKATAEPTIKELQHKIDSLQGYLDHDIEYDIEQENLKLKAYNEKLLNSDIEKHNKIVSLEAEKEQLKKRNGELAGQKASLERWFGEAKSIIKSLIDRTYGEGWNYSLDVKVKAEKFLRSEE